MLIFFVAVNTCFRIRLVLWTHHGFCLRLLLCSTYANLMKWWSCAPMLIPGNTKIVCVLFYTSYEFPPPTGGVQVGRCWDPRAYYSPFHCCSFRSVENTSYWNHRWRGQECVKYPPVGVSATYIHTYHLDLAPMGLQSHSEDNWGQISLSLTCSSPDRCLVVVEWLTQTYENPELF